MIVWGGENQSALESGGRYALSRDNDHDGVTVCGGDCNDADAGAFALPGEVAILVWNNKTTLAWTPAGPGAGSGTVHDVVRGQAGQWPVGTGTSEQCLASGIGAATAIDATLPPAGTALWYLARGRNSCGAGSYGFATGGTERMSGACP